MDPAIGRNDHLESLTTLLLTIANLIIGPHELTGQSGSRLRRLNHKYEKFEEMFL
jgi:hypothetical protein